MKVAAAQMVARLGDVEYNLERARRLVDRAFSEGCELVILPEFFTSAVAYDPVMKKAARPLDSPVLKILLETARRHRGFVGGSFIATRGGDNYNTFVMAFPDGGYALHDKDQPTMWENCWYRAGDDDGILETPLGPVGVALCWEFIRSRTVERLLGRVDMLVGGSCWWTVPGPAIPIPGKKHAHLRNSGIMKEAPSRMARMLGVPVVHAAHAGEFTGRMPLLPGLPYRSYFLGEAQVVDAEGNVLARLGREEGEGLAMAEIEPGRLEPALDPPGGFWIPDLPPLIRAVWFYQNAHGRRYYARHREGLTG